jgi:hypothetical protein
MTQFFDIVRRNSGCIRSGRNDVRDGLVTGAALPEKRIERLFAATEQPLVFQSRGCASQFVVTILLMYISRDWTRNNICDNPNFKFTVERWRNSTFYQVISHSFIRYFAFNFRFIYQGIPIADRNWKINRSRDLKRLLSSDDLSCGTI